MAALDDFLSFLQGASNSAASAVSAPVDGINWALGKVGVPVSKKPVGGSEWLKELGFTAEPKNKTAGLLGEAVGGVLPIVAQAKAPQIAAGINQMISNAQAPRTLNPQTGAIVWHGSPHKFDKFDSSKIGTGEGAQAYGHGLYLAESPDVAKTYRSVGTDASYNRVTGGMSPMEEYAFDMVEQGSKGDDLFSKMMQRYGKLLKSDKDFDAFDAAIKRAESSAGNLYKVDLPDEHIAKMLDWDKPLSQQAPETIEALHKTGLVNFEKNLGPKASGEIGDLGWTKSIQSMSAEDFYRKLTEGAYTNEMFLQGQKKGAAQAVISDRLKSAGIPGIRYLDGGSRGVGQGTSNFVVFPGNEGLLSILGRNGQPLR